MKKRIVCFGDSNTHGYCADPADNEEHGIRFSENERWTRLLQKKLGDDYFIVEEGLSGRTTVFNDYLHESMSGLDSIYSCLMSHGWVDLLVIMLGTNDTKERFGVNAFCISLGLDRLIKKAKSIEAWRGEPNILVICPPHIGREMNDPGMGKGCAEKSEELAPYYKKVAEANGCAFLDAQGIAEFNRIDFMHLTAKGHRDLSDKLAELIPGLV